MYCIVFADLSRFTFCRKDQFAVLNFLQVIIVLIQVYDWELRHHSTVCRCGHADILYFDLHSLVCNLKSIKWIVHLSNRDSLASHESIRGLSDVLTP